MLKSVRCRNVVMDISGLSEIMQDFFSLRSFHFDFMSVLLNTKRPSCLDFSVCPVSPLGSSTWRFHDRSDSFHYFWLPCLRPSSLARSFLEMGTIRFRRLAISNLTVAFTLTVALPSEHPIRRSNFYPFKDRSNWNGLFNLDPLWTMSNYSTSLNLPWTPDYCGLALIYLGPPGPMSSADR